MTRLSLLIRLFLMQEGLGFEVVPEADLSESPPLRKPHVRQKTVFRSVREPELYPTDLDSLLPAESPARCIRKALDEIDVSVLQGLYEDHGGVPYEPAPMLGILLLAYLLGITGSGKIEELCRYDIRFMHVGHGQKPDDRTIRRFRRRVAPFADELFAVILKACKERNLVKMRRVAIDGTKIAAAASQLNRWLTDAEKQDIADMGFEVPESSDPEARTMKGARGYVLGYNCQAAVDCDSGIVVAYDVTDCSADSASLVPVVEKIVELTGELPSQIVADAGYDSSEGISGCEALGLDAIVAQQNTSGLFWIVTPEGEILCPMGNQALPAGIVMSRGKPHQVLRVQGCKSCQFFGSCCSSRGSGRTLQVPVGCNPVDRLTAAYRARTPEGKHAMVERMATIERVFADIKWNKGIQRLRLRGIEGARLEWTLILLARNLKILGRGLAWRLWLLLLGRFAPQRGIMPVNKA